MAGREPPGRGSPCWGAGTPGDSGSLESTAGDHVALSPPPSPTSFPPHTHTHTDTTKLGGGTVDGGREWGGPRGHGQDFGLVRLTGGHRAAERSGARRRFVLSDHASGRSQARADLGAAHSTAHASRWGARPRRRRGHMPGRMRAGLWPGVGRTHPQSGRGCGRNRDRCQGSPNSGPSRGVKGDRVPSLIPPTSNPPWGPHSGAFLHEASLRKGLRASGHPGRTLWGSRGCDPGLRGGAGEKGPLCSSGGSLSPRPFWKQEGDWEAPLLVHFSH